MSASGIFSASMLACLASAQIMPSAEMLAPVLAPAPELELIELTYDVSEEDGTLLPSALAPSPFQESTQCFRNLNNALRNLQGVQVFETLARKIGLTDDFQNPDLTGTFLIPTNKAFSNALELLASEGLSDLPQQEHVIAGALFNHYINVPFDLTGVEESTTMMSHLGTDLLFQEECAELVFAPVAGQDFPTITPTFLDGSLQANVLQRVCIQDEAQSDLFVYIIDTVLFSACDTAPLTAPTPAPGPTLVPTPAPSLLLAPAPPPAEFTPSEDRDIVIEQPSSIDEDGEDRDDESDDEAGIDEQDESVDDDVESDDDEDEDDSKGAVALLGGSVVAAVAVSLVALL